MIETPAFHDLFWLFEFVAMVNWGYSSAVKEIHLPVMVSLDSLRFYMYIIFRGSSICLPYNMTQT